MSEPKNQHIIPRCYLKQWVDPNTPTGQVWIFERNSKIGKKRSPKKILSKTDFYTLKGKDYRIENTLAQIENDYARIFEEKIKNKIPLTKYEHAVFCAFVAAMFLRTSRHKENVENLYDQIIEMTESFEKAKGIPPNESVRLKTLREDAHKLNIIKMAPHITQTLLEMNLAFFCSENAGAFITSDAPCYLFNSSLQWKIGPWASPGFMQRHVEVRIPLSTGILATFSWANNFRGYLKINQDWVHEQNRMTRSRSHEYFIANSQKIKRIWFSRYPLDPIFIVRVIIHKLKRSITLFKYERKYRV